MRILISDPLSEIGLTLLRDSGFECIYMPKSDNVELERIVKVVDAWIIRSGTKINFNLINISKNLKAIGRAGVGVDNINLDAATRKGIVVMNVPDINTISAAEHTMALILALSRNIYQGHLGLSKGIWNRHRLTGSELKNKKIGIIGLGKIGREVMTRCNSFGMEVFGYDPFVNSEVFDKNQIKIISFDDIIKKVDYLTIHIPMTKNTKGLFNYKIFEKMKRTARIINVARGGIINEKDLAKALNKNLILGAAIDVFEKEPIDSKNYLLDAPNILLTPHLGASTHEAKERVSYSICKQICDYLKENKLTNAVNIPISNFSKIKRIKPLLELSELLGSLISQIQDGPIYEVIVEGEGTASDVSPISLACLNGLLKSRVPERINFINANSIAKELGIKVTSQYNLKKSNYNNLITVKVNIDNKIYRFDGSLFDNNEFRIVNVLGWEIEILPKGVMLIIENNDVPGVIGEVGTYIGNLNINIAAYLLSRRKGNLNALAVIRLDGQLLDEQLEEIKNIKNISSVNQINTNYSLN
ncbi:MAG: phosphoglycerate dehydrogenase [Candidatus Neomarinimicrobiota bacterium]